MRSLSMSSVAGCFDLMMGSLSLRRSGGFSSESTTSTPRMTIALTVVPSDAALLFKRRYFVSGMSTVVLTTMRLPYLWLGGF